MCGRKTLYLPYDGRTIEICIKSIIVSLCVDQEGGQLFEAKPIKGNYLVEERTKNDSTSEKHHSKSGHGHSKTGSNKYM